MTLDEKAVRAALRMKDLIPAMASALADLSGGKVVQPVRVMVPVADHQGFLGIMPAYGSALGAKLVTFYPQNQGVHTHHAMILLFRPETGEPLATMDGRLITEMRTAGIGGGHTAPRAAGSFGPEHPRLWRPGAEPPRGDAPGAHVPRGARVEPAERVGVRQAIRDPRGGVGGRGRARRRCGRGGDDVADAGAVGR